MFWEILLGLIMPAASFAPGSVLGLASADFTTPVVDSITVEAFSDHRMPFDVRFGETQTDYRVMAMFVLPGENVPVAVVNPTTTYEIQTKSGMAVQTGQGAWTWAAPSRPGLYPVEIREQGSDRAMLLNVFVMVPFSTVRRGSLNGYRIGHYPKPRSE